MPGKGKARGHTMGKDRGGAAGGSDSVGGSDPRGGDGTGHGKSGWAGRSEESPGHLKKAAGARSARDFAPGHQMADRPEGTDPYLERDIVETRRG
jgi:hypothetical protein